MEKGLYYKQYIINCWRMSYIPCSSMLSLVEHSHKLFTSHQRRHTTQHHFGNAENHKNEAELCVSMWEDFTRMTRMKVGGGGNDNLDKGVFSRTFSCTRRVGEGFFYVLVEKILVVQTFAKYTLLQSLPIAHTRFTNAVTIWGTIHTSKDCLWACLLTFDFASFVYKG